MTSDSSGYTPEISRDTRNYAALARKLEAQGENWAAATAYDRAYGLAPHDTEVASARAALLAQLSVVEHGIVFRYIPAGTFLMGSDAGDPDENPVHPVSLNAFWLAETPVSWDKYCELMGLESRMQGTIDRIRVQYCEDETLQAGDWHAHVPDQIWQGGDGKTFTAEEFFGQVPRESDDPLSYSRKPMVAVDPTLANKLCHHLSSQEVLYRLPTEAEWEKAARGGLIEARYPWGDELPTPDRCDYDRFEDFSIRPMRAFPPNGYGLYAMSGGVWELTSDRYDAEYYRGSPYSNPRGPEKGEEHVLRGGSWTDCADAVRVSFRMSRKYFACPTIGFRLCRELRILQT